MNPEELLTKIQLELDALCDKYNVVVESEYGADLIIHGVDIDEELAVDQLGNGPSYAELAEN